MKFRIFDILPIVILLSTLLIVAFQLTFEPLTFRNITLAFFKFSGMVLIASALYAISHESSGRLIRYLTLSGCLLLAVYLIIIFI